MASQHRVLVHIDMDAFFASVEQRDDPMLRGRPTLVGRSHRGVVCAASYEARAFGVRSAMPMAEALRRCPDAAVCAPRFSAYKDASAQVFAIFRRFTPLVQGLSLDEATLDVTGSQALYGAGAVIAQAIRQAIADEVRLPASAGIAPNKFLAKLVCDQAKPNGLKEVLPSQQQAFLAPLPIEVLFGVGKKGAAKLHAHGLRYLADVWEWSDDQLSAHFGHLGQHIALLSRGEDDRRVTPDVPNKQVGSESTFDVDISRIEDLHHAMLKHALTVSARLAKLPAYAFSVQIKLKTHDFSLITREASLPAPAFDADSLFLAAKRLLAKLDLGHLRFRLAGLSAKDIRPGEPPRLLLPEPRQQKSEAIETMRAKMAAKFGATALTRASLLHSNKDAEA